MPTPRRADLLPGWWFTYPFQSVLRPIGIQCSDVVIVGDWRVAGGKDDQKAQDEDELSEMSGPIFSNGYRPGSYTLLR